MILKGSQRSGGCDLATHLMNGFDNEHVKIAQIRNVVADDLHGAFSEYEAAATGTRCKKPLYSLSINPATPLTQAQYLAAIDRIENKLGLSGQPRAIVFHTKKGREHCHVVWSRIDIKAMRAIHISHDRFKLKALSKELAVEFGLTLPPGLDPEGAPDAAPPEPSLADNAHTTQTGISPKQRRFEITEAYMACDNGQAFHTTLVEMGYHLAKGTRRSYVIIDQYGHVHSLSRYIEGVRGKQINKKLADIDHNSLPSIEEVKAQMEKWPEPQPSAALARKLQIKLDELQSKRRLELVKEMQGLEISQREELIFLKISQQQDFEQTYLRLLSSALSLFASMPSMSFVASYLSKKLFRHVRDLHAREVSALKRRHRIRFAQKKRQLKILKKIEQREDRAVQMALLKISRTSTRHRQDFKVNHFDITYVSSLNQIDDQPYNPELEALEREYAPTFLSQVFNLVANPRKSDEDGNELTMEPNSHSPQK